MVVFSAGKDSYKEKWEGARTSYEDIVMHFKADDAQPITAFPSVLKSLASAYSSVFLDVPESATGTRRGRGLSHKALLKVHLSLTFTLSPTYTSLQFLSPGLGTPKSEYNSVVDSISSSKLRALAPEVAKLRAVKSSAEQRIMRAAADISGLAHAKVCLSQLMPLAWQAENDFRQCASRSPACQNTV